MFTLISYDVVHDRRRQRLAKLLAGHGQRVQYSVFECELTSLQLTRLMREIGQIISPQCDSVRIYRLDEAAVGRIMIVGVGSVTQTPTHYRL